MSYLPNLQSDATWQAHLKDIPTNVLQALASTWQQLHALCLQHEPDSTTVLRLEGEVEYFCIEEFTPGYCWFRWEVTQDQSKWWTDGYLQVTFQGPGTVEVANYEVEKILHLSTLIPPQTPDQFNMVRSLLWGAAFLVHPDMLQELPGSLAEHQQLAHTWKIVQDWLTSVQ